LFFDDLAVDIDAKVVFSEYEPIDDVEEAYFGQWAN
jgi:hypothetical protein